MSKVKNVNCENNGSVWFTPLLKKILNDDIFSPVFLAEIRKWYNHEIEYNANWTSYLHHTSHVNQLAFESSSNRLLKLEDSIAGSIKICQNQFETQKNSNSSISSNRRRLTTAISNLKDISIYVSRTYDQLKERISRLSQHQSPSVIRQPQEIFEDEFTELKSTSNTNSESKSDSKFKSDKTISIPSFNTPTTRAQITINAASTNKETSGTLNEDVSGAILLNNTMSEIDLVDPAYHVFPRHPLAGFIHDLNE